ncbi:MAG: glycosyltransferase [Dehalococcoidia bacterium]|nr:glycosyltransferase [Dehalococcoidia bacterium]
MTDEPESASRHTDGCSTAPPERGITIGLVVTCYTLDRLEDTLRLIKSIAGQTSPLDQLVVVVQRSWELHEALRSALARLEAVPLSLLFLESATGVSRARNAGIHRMMTDVVAFVDDDSVLFDDWVAATRSFYCEHPRAIGAAGAIVPLWDDPGMQWFPRELYWMLSCTYWSFSSPTPVRNGYGANMSFRREAFEAGRRFSEACGVGAWGTAGWRGVGGEEPELALRISAATGRQILFAPEVRAWHRVRAHRLRSANLLRRAYWDGRLKAALSSQVAVSSGVLDTEFGLLGVILRAQLARLRSLLSSPIVSLRQTALVVLVVATVGVGFLEGKVRRQRLVCEIRTSDVDSGSVT